MTDRLILVSATAGSFAAGGNITLEAVYAQNLKPCPECELRIVTDDATICRHCARERAARRTRKKWVLLMVAIYFSMLAALSGGLQLGLANRALVLTTAAATALLVVVQILAGTCLQRWRNARAESRNWRVK